MTEAPAGLMRPSGLSSEQEQIAELAFAIGARYAERRFDDHEASLEQWGQLSTTGLTSLSLPEQYGGVGGMFELCLAAERLAAGGFPAAKLIISTAIAGSMFARHGTAEQRRHWLPGIAAGTTRFCFAFTEPSAGSNARNLRTVATRSGETWRIRGEKTYISALESSDAMLLVTKDAASGALALFAFPLTGQQEIETVKVQVDAPAFEFQWSVFFDGLELTDEQLIGGPTGGAKALFDGLNPERLIVAAQSVGIGRWCLAKACQYAKQRVVFDVPIATHQALAHPLAEAYVALEGAAALVDRATRLYDTGNQAGVESNIAKIAACDAGLRAADVALQVFGGSGYTDQTMMLQRFTYMRLLRSIPVSRELALNHIASAGLSLPRSY